MDYGKSFSFVFEDKDWLRKIGMSSLAVLVGFILLVIPAILYILGYQIAVARNVLNGEKEPLPEPDNWGEMFSEGATVFGITLVYQIPLFLLMCVAVGLIAAGGGLSDATGSGALGATLGVVGILFYCIYIIVAIVLSFVMYAALVQYVREGTFAACMRFSEVWALFRNNIGDYILVVLCVIGAGIVAQLATSISIVTVCGPLILLFPAMLWQTAVSGHLLGQLAINAGGNNKEELYNDFA